MLEQKPGRAGPAFLGPQPAHGWPHQAFEAYLLRNKWWLLGSHSHLLAALSHQWVETNGEVKSPGPWGLNGGKHLHKETRSRRHQPEAC